MHDGRDWYWQSRWSGPDDGYHHDARVAPEDLRISDVERTEVINQLCRHFGDGRLDQAELDERTAKAMAAKTGRDLAPLLADLPPLDHAPVPGPPPPARRPGFPLVLALVVALLVAASWPARIVLFHVPWVLIFVLVLVLLRRGRHGRARG